MDYIELVKSFQREIHQGDNVPRVDTGDIVYFLNKAQENFIKDKFAGKKTTREGFQESQDLIDDLRTFYKKDCLTETVYAGPSAHAGDTKVDQTFLPEDYLHLVETRAKVQVSTDFNKYGKRTDFDWRINPAMYKDKRYNKRVARSGQSYEEKIVPTNTVQSQRVYGMLSSPFRAPRPNRPLSDLNNNRVSVYTSSKFIVDTIIINYIRSPKSITIKGSGQTSELPEEFHRELVDRAVRLFLEKRPQRSPSSQDD